MVRDTFINMMIDNFEIKDLISIKLMSSSLSVLTKNVEQLSVASSSKASSKSLEMAKTLNDMRETYDLNSLTRSAKSIVDSSANSLLVIKSLFCKVG